MPSKPIQTLPVGLLGLLQVKNLGANPSILLDEVRPTVEMFDMWTNFNLEQDSVTHQRDLATGAGSVQAFGTGPINVPDGEWWWVKNYTIVAVVPAVAGELVENIAPAILYNSSGPLVWQQLTETSRNVTGAALAQSQGAIMAKDFWAPAGASLGVFSGRAVTATVISVFGLLRFCRIPI